MMMIKLQFSVLISVNFSVLIYKPKILKTTESDMWTKVRESNIQLLYYSK